MVYLNGKTIEILLYQKNSLRFSVKERAIENRLISIEIMS